jgi:signal peptidase I
VSLLLKVSRSRLARLFGALACCYFLLIAFEIALVPTRSMETTVLVGDHILVFKLFDAPRMPGTSMHLPRLRAPHRGALVSFLAPDATNTVYLKRIVAVAGDTVEMRGGIFYLNGNATRETYARRSTHVPDLSPRRLKDGELFVLGDNRDLSEDSRDFGPIAVASVVGTPTAVLWSARARTRDLLDAQGNVRVTFYWTAVRHLLASTRWSRTGKLL